MAAKREIILIGLCAAAIALVMSQLGMAYSVRMLVEASCYAIIALGLNIQWGYAGLFNAGIMGFVAVGGAMTMLVSYPINQQFWASSGPAELGKALFYAAVTLVAALALRQFRRRGLPSGITTLLMVIVIATGYLFTVSALQPAAALIEKESGFVGGLGLPVWLGWIVGGIAAGVISYFIGRICLGLRSDYLAIATLGIAEIIKAVLKNADWLTRGTLTVSPLPWPVATPGEIGFVAARSAYLAVTVTMIVIIFFFLQRAYHAPWGRMMRAIRDNEVAAGSMGKDVNRRRLEIFVLGSVLMGVGGSALVSFSRIFRPLRIHTTQPHISCLGHGYPGRSGQQSRRHHWRAAGLHYLDHVRTLPHCSCLKWCVPWAKAGSTGRPPAISIHAPFRCAYSSLALQSRWFCALRQKVCYPKRSPGTTNPVTTKKSGWIVKITSFNDDHFPRHSAFNAFYKCKANTFGRDGFVTRKPATVSLD